MTLHNEPASVVEARVTSSSSLYRGQVIAGPMVRVSALAFRVLCANQGAGVVFTEEMVSAKLSKATREVVVYRIPFGLLPNNNKTRPPIDMIRLSNEGTFDLSSNESMAQVNARLVDVDVVEYVVYEAFKNMLKRQVVFSTIARSDRNRLHQHVDLDDGGNTGYYPEGSPLVAQLGAADPAVAAAAASVVCEDVDGIDVNMGCPKKFSIDNGMGAALMSAPERAGAILKAINDAVNSPDRVASRPHHRRIPISFKTRVFSDVSASVSQLRRVVECSGFCVHAITLHARTRDQRSETAPLQSHAELVVTQCRREHPTVFPEGLCFVYNGSVDHREQADLFVKRRLHTSPFEGAMLSRSAMWDPSVFTAHRHTTAPFVSEALGSPAEISRVYKAMMLLHRVYHTNFTYVKYHLTRSYQEFPCVKKTVHPKMQSARSYGAFAELVGFDRETAQRDFGMITFEELLPKSATVGKQDAVRQRESGDEILASDAPVAKEARVEGLTSSA
ncbi:tRNA-dihydrouridine synthase 2, putative [Bodo saltans]|uniref:tRNA-dihydrouridine synthase 2, putative n=1 Tax=Bodo saltans TaxID=75058 RepID=A0A0S4JLG1_BODSA|nr:tRNA-dihydrouridine synthase 2, putative [Bodo saltans]|eukprot:CUG91210.1 tRNA-dihydrouridine synthase 2, putative [Bodo saltans]